MLRRGVLLSGSTPASHGISPRRSRARRASRSRGMRGSASARDERPLDRRVDRAFDPAELFVIGEPQRAGLAIVEIELLQREGEQRQRVAGARLDVDEQALRQRRFDRQFAARLLHPSRRPLDHVADRRRAASAAARTQPAAGLRAPWRFAARRRNRSGW